MLLERDGGLDALWEWGQVVEFKQILNGSIQCIPRLVKDLLLSKQAYICM